MSRRVACDSVSGRLRLLVVAVALAVPGGCGVEVQNGVSTLHLVCQCPVLCRVVPHLLWFRVVSCRVGENLRVNFSVSCRVGYPSVSRRAVPDTSCWSGVTCRVMSALLPERAASCPPYFFVSATSVPC